ncbi:MAG: glycosyltransferase family 87 protein [Candidatus Auribacterota bacterium]
MMHLCSKTYHLKKIFVLCGAIAVFGIFLLSLRTGLIDSLFNDSTHRIGKGGDFFQFYQAGYNLTQGSSIYLPGSEPLVIPYGAIYKYPPFAAYTVGLVSQLTSPWIAYSCWVLLILCCFVLLWFLISHAVLAAGKRLFPFFLFCCFTPLYIDLYMGQTNTIMALLLCLILILNSPSFVWALSVNVKMHTLLLLPVYIKQRKMKIILYSALSSFLLFIPYFFWHPFDLKHFVEYVFGTPLEYFYQAGNLGMYPLIQDLVQLVTYNTSTIAAVQFMWSIGIVAVSLWVMFTTQERDTRGLLSLWVCTFFVGYKFVWEHHLVMLLPVLAVEYMNRDRRTVAVIWFFLALPTVFWFVDMPIGERYAELQPYLSDTRSILYHSCKIIPLLLLYSSVICRLLNVRLPVKRLAVALLAAVLFAEAVSAVSLSARDCIARALKCELNEDIPAANLWYKKAYFINPNYIDGLIHYANFLQEQGLDEEFSKCVHRVYRLDPDNPVFGDLKTPKN